MTLPQRLRNRTNAPRQCEGLRLLRDPMAARVSRRVLRTLHTLGHNFDEYARRMAVKASQVSAWTHPGSTQTPALHHLALGESDVVWALLTELLELRARDGHEEWRLVRVKPLTAADTSELDAAIARVRELAARGR